MMEPPPASQGFSDYIQQPGTVLGQPNPGYPQMAPPTTDPYQQQPAYQQPLAPGGFQPDYPGVAPPSPYGVPSPQYSEPVGQTAPYPNMPPMPPPQQAPETPTWDAPLAQQTMPPLPQHDPYFNNPAQTVDDFWAHSSPGFDETAVAERPILPQDVTGQFMDNVHQQLYPQDIPGTVQAPPAYSGQVSPGGFAPPSQPVAVGVGGLNLPPLEAETNLDEVFSKIEEASKIEPTVPSLYDLPPGTANPMQGWGETHTMPNMAPIPDPMAAAMPQMGPPPAQDWMATPSQPYENQPYQGDPYQAMAANQAMQSSPPVMETILPQDIAVLDVYTLNPSQSLMFVEARGAFALMGMVNQQYITVKLFDVNPKSPQLNQFQVAPGNPVGNQQVFQVMIGHWQGVVGTDGHGFSLMSEFHTN